MLIGTHRLNHGAGFVEVSGPIKVDVVQLPHAEGLPLPATKAAEAAGL